MNSETALQMLVGSIGSIDPKYIISGDCAQNDQILQVERSFAYELYHQWSNKLNTFKEIFPDNENLMISAEITKHHVNDHSFPDLFLHGGQDNMDSQLIVCEIKRKNGSNPSKEEVKRDINKLQTYIRELHYEETVFILINGCPEEFKHKLCKWYDSNEIENNELTSKINIICVWPTNQNVKFEIFKLSQIHKN